MDNRVEAPKMESTQRKSSEKLHKGSSILSVVALLLTFALFVRIETVARDMKTVDSKFTQQIQQIQEALKEAVTTQRERKKKDYDIVSGRLIVFS